MEVSQQQSEFLTEVKERFQDPKWSVSSFPKTTEQPGTWNTFKLKLLEFCMENGLYFLEKRNFLHVGKTHQICEYADTRLQEHLSKMPKGQAEGSLN